MLRTALSSFPDAAVAEFVLVVVEEERAFSIFRFGEGVVCRLCGQHSGPHCGVGAFDFGDVEEACSVADQGAAGEGAFGDGLEATFV